MTKKFLFCILSCFFATSVLADDTIVVLCENNYYVNENINYNPYNPGLPYFFAALDSNRTATKSAAGETNYNSYLNILRTYRMMKTSLASSTLGTCIKCPGSGTITGKSTCTIKTDKIECEFKTRDNCTIALNRKDKTGVFYYNNIESCVYSPTTTTTSSSGTSTESNTNNTISGVAAAAAAAAATGNAYSTAAAAH